MDYATQIINAVDFIENHLGEDISLDMVATHVHLSAYHFHRIFSGILGESVKEYVRKRRLAEAAKQLISTNTSILEIALDCNFESQESFTRAFKRMFGRTPGEFRNRGTDQLIFDKRRTSLDMIQHLANGVTMEPKIITRDKELVIGIGRGFPEESYLAIKDLWDRFVGRRNEIKNAKGSYELGVCCISLPNIPKQQGDAFVYIAGAPVSSIDQIPEGMVACEIPSSRYAVFTHKGPLSNLPNTNKYIWGTWITKGEYQIKETPDFELYDRRFGPESQSSEFDIYVPIV